MEPDQERRDAQLEKVAQESALLKEMSKTPGYKILARLLVEHVDALQAKWVRAKTPEECWQLKLQAGPWQEVLDIVTKRILLGEKVTELLQKKDDLESDSRE